MSETVWTFETKRFRVTLELDRDLNYRYDGDDEDGEVQLKLDTGEYVAFDSTVTVYFDDTEVGVDHLGGSVYSWDKVQEFWTGHRDPDPANRNCMANAYRVGHYFPDMVKEACQEARKHLCSAPKMRCGE
jgi:hypothetical protein